MVPHEPSIPEASAGFCRREDHVYRGAQLSQISAVI
jgi:hypothetical protein